MSIIKRGLCFLLATSSTFLVVKVACHNYVSLYQWLLRRVCAGDSTDPMESDNFNVIWTNDDSANCTKDMDTRPQKNTLIHMKLLYSNEDCGNPYCTLKNRGKLLRLFNTARFSIDIAMYVITNIDISAALLKASRRGVTVRLITDSQMCDRVGNSTLMLLRNDIVIKTNERPMLMHHKFCLIDCSEHVPRNSRRRRTWWRPDTQTNPGLLITGSLNWTKKGFSGNWENFIITSKPDLIATYTQEFSRMWSAFNRV